MADSSGSGVTARRRLPPLIGNLVMGALAVVVTLLLCELLLRLLGIGYPVYVWTDRVVGVAHIPGAQSEREHDGMSWIEINQDGMRGPEASLKAAPGTYRIALLGDSFIEAFEVPYQKTVGEVIERKLSAARGTPVEVLNFGVGGYGTTQELLTLRHKVWKYSPDLVLLAVTTGNDISDNYKPLSPGSYRPYYNYEGSRLVLDTTFLASAAYRSRAVWTRRLLSLVNHSRIIQLLNRVRHTRRKSDRQENVRSAPGDELGLRDEVQVPPKTPEWREAWRVTEGVLLMMRDECRAKHTPLAVVTLTRGIQVTPLRDRKNRFLSELGAKDLYYPERRLSEFGRREGIPVLNLAPTMAKEAEERQVYFHAFHDSLGVGHWNADGHEAAGERIAAWLSRTDLRSPASVQAPDSSAGKLSSQ